MKGLRRNEDATKNKSSYQKNFGTGATGDATWFSKLTTKAQQLLNNISI
jgi:hypothetical protein